jgi:RNA polymerase sigma-70 factor (ECF subfamily)
MAQQEGVLERQILLEAKGGSKEAFAALVKAYFPRLYRAAYGFLRNVEDSADLCQEAFLRAYRNMARFDAGKTFYPWIYKILRNLCINHLRGRKRHTLRATDLEELESGYPAPEKEVLRKEELELLHRAIDRLPEMHREILLLKTYGDASYQEIAEILSIPIGTVMSRLYNARVKLRGILDAEGETYAMRRSEA